MPSAISYTVRRLLFNALHFMHVAANYGGPDKALHTPDVRVLADLAEQAGLDLRILVLMRRADEILRSTV